MAKKKIRNQIKNTIVTIINKRDSEYSKRMLTKIVNHSMLMMWASYVLAWFGKTEIAEALSKTIATSVIAVVVGYLAKSVLENISKHTDTFGRNVDQVYIDQIVEDKTENANRDC